MERERNDILDLAIALFLLAILFNISLSSVLLFTAKTAQKISAVVGGIGLECEKRAYRLNELNEKRSLT